MARCGRLRRPRVWLLASGAILWLPRALCADDLARRVVIVYNQGDPDSRPLADYYAQRRGVPTNQLCSIHVRLAETITRQEYNDQIRDPIWRFLTKQGLLSQEPRTIFDSVLGKIPGLGTVSTKISYLVLMYG